MKAFILISLAAFAGLLTCDAQVIQPKIIRGSATTPGEFPFIVSLDHLNATTGAYKHFCAGSIVDATHIVTAAHCVWNYTASMVTILAGAYNLSATEASQQRVQVSVINVHPNYTSRGSPGPYDVAVLVLATPLALNAQVNVVGLNTVGHFPSGKCTNMGWGNKFPVSSISYQGSDVLLKGETGMITKTTCQLLGGYLPYRVQLQTAVCGANVNLFTMTFNPGQGTCQGDSGGPVVCYNSDKTPYLAGIVSWGFIYCGVSPDVYTDISNAAIKDWLDSVLIANQ